MTGDIDVSDAAAILRSARRVIVVGCSGGGKSTLAQKIAGQLSLRYVSLDRDVIWCPGWKERPAAERRSLIAQFAAGDRWIMDGTSTSSFDLRLPHADIVLWVRLPRLLCVWGVVTRWLKYVGRTRPEMAAGCPERLEWQFLNYIWTFETVQTPRILVGLEKHGLGVPVVMLKSRSDMRRLLDLSGIAA